MGLLEEALGPDKSKVSLVDEALGPDADLKKEWEKATPISSKEWDEATPVWKSAGRSWTDVPGEAVSNFLPSAGRLIKGVVEPVLHPVKTLEGISRMTRGGLGISPEEAPAWESTKKFFVNRYGSEEALKNTIATDPAGFAADISTILSGGGGVAARAPGVVGKVGAAVRGVGEVINPLNMATAPVRELRTLVGKTNIPEEIYARTMKMPPGSLGEEGRAKVMQTLVREEKLPLGNETLSQINTITGELDEKITGVLKNLSAKGSEFGVNVVTNALDKLKNTYRNRPNPQPYYDAIDAVKQDYITHSFVNEGKISLIDAHDLKKGTYQEIQSYYMKGQRPETGRVGIQNDIDSASKAKAAATLRDTILKHPDVPASVKTDLSRQAGLMNARKWVERATNRGGNLDPVSLSGLMFGILVEKGLPGVAAWRIATTQPVMSRLSLFLAHGSETGQAVGKFVRPAALGARGVDLIGDREP
jgi:hypothetical protein